MLNCSSARQLAVLRRFHVSATASSAASGATSGTAAEPSAKLLREKALADAVAREEAAQAKAKLLIELKQQSQDLISQLNQTPAEAARARVALLQHDLAAVDGTKIRQLDQELEDFLLSHMKLPASEIHNRPWADLTAAKKSIVPGDVGASAGTNSGSASASSTASSFLNKFPYLTPSADHHPYSSQELYLRHLNHTRHTGSLGSNITNVYQPKNEIKRPKSISDISISSLLAAGCHLGHAKALWRPSTQPFIYGEYNGIHLIDLNETLIALKRAVKVIKGVANKGGLILYVGTSKNWEQHRALEEAATRSNGYYVSKKWIPGTITNFTQVTRQQNERRVEVNMLNEPTNRDLSKHDEILKPDLIVLMNPVENRNCINECIKLRIPTIGLCDTDMEPSLLTYAIPANDDSMRVLSLMLGVLSRAASEGIQERIAAVKRK